MSAKRMMWEWRVKLNIPDYLTQDQEDALLDAITEHIEADQIRRFVEDKLGSFVVEVEVLE